MPSASQWVFGPFRLDTTNMCLWQGCDTVALKPKTFTVLQYLVAHAGQLVTKAALLDAVWPETAVSDGVLKVCIAELRKALGDRVQTPQFIATVHRHGYRFVAPVTSTAAPLGTPTIRPAASPPLLSCSDASIPSSLHGQVRPPNSLLERDTVLARLHTAWTHARRGQRQCVFVTGEAGIGKTAVMETFVTQAAADPVVWLAQGQCVEYYGTGEAYLPILEALGQLCRLPQGERLVTLLRQQAPTWLVQMPWLLTPEDRERLSYELHGTTRDRMLREFAAVIDTLTAAAPLLLVLEDLHWSDYATLDLLAFLARSRTPAQLLVLGTYRPVEAMIQEHPLRAVVYGLQRQGQGMGLPLEGLSAAAVATYLAAHLPGHQFPEGLAGWLHQHTNGNPLFVVTLVAALQARGVLAEREGRWRLLTEPARLALEVPEGLRPLLEQQLARLAPDTQRVLEIASIAGIEFATPAVVAGLETGVDVVEACCEALVRRRLLRPMGMTTWPDGTRAMRYAFVHALYQHVAYQRLGDGQRLRLHQRLGLRLETAYGSQASVIAAELAEHFVRGQDTERAVRYLHLAGVQAQQRSAHQEAFRHFTQGLELLATQPETPARARDELRLYRALGISLIATHGFGAAAVEQTYTRARQLCQQLQDTQELFPVLFGLWGFYDVRANLQQARATGEQLLALAQSRHDPALLIPSHRALGETLFWLGETVEARTHLEQSNALYDPQQYRDQALLYGHDPGASCLGFLARTLWALGYPDQALQRSREALVLAQQLAHPFSLAFVLRQTIAFHQLRRETQEVLARVQMLLTLATKHGFAQMVATGMRDRGWVLTMQGHVAEGIAQMRQGGAAHRATGAEVSRPYLLALLAEALGKAGEAEEGLGVLAEGLTLVENHEERVYEAELYRLKGELLLALSGDHHTAAHACFQHALDVARRQQAKSLELRAAMSLGQLWQRQGKRNAARQLLGEVYGWFTEGFDTADLQAARALLAALA
jgi:predicted ATPase/DNA-binding winged helix-turn-helix (wHTH) protein